MEEAGAQEVAKIPGDLSAMLAPGRTQSDLRPPPPAAAPTSTVSERRMAKVLLIREVGVTNDQCCIGTEAIPFQDYNGSLWCWSERVLQRLFIGI